MNIDLSGQRFRVSLLENPRGEFLYLQEIQNTPTTGETIAGGVIVRKENIEALIEGIFKLCERESAKQWKDQQKKLKKNV